MLMQVENSPSAVSIEENRLPVVSPVVAKKTKLRPRLERFCKAYTSINILDRNGNKTFRNIERSAIFAGFSEKNADKNSYKLLGAKGVEQRIEELDQAKHQSTEYTAQDAMSEIDGIKGLTPALKLKAIELKGRIKGFMKSDNEVKASVALVQHLDSQLANRMGVISLSNPQELLNITNEKDANSPKSIDINT